MSEDLDLTAAVYALGIDRGAARAEVEARLPENPALQAKVKLWQDNFAALDLAAGELAPPAGLFGKIMEAIEAGGDEMAGTVTRRAGSGIWAEMAPGVTFTVLFEDQVAKRRSMLVRAVPGATFESHLHAEGFEECLVLEGDLIIGDLRLVPGDYHVAVKGSTHPLETTATGCLIFLSTAL